MLSKGVAAFRAFTRNLPVWFRPLWPRSECPKFSIDARKRTGSIPPDAVVHWRSGEWPESTLS